MTTYEWNYDLNRKGTPYQERRLMEQECVQRIKRFAAGRISERDVRGMLRVMDRQESYNKEVK